MNSPFDYSRFRVVVVSGPQRSGTTIGARIIAHDSGMDYVDEDAYGTKDLQAWSDLVVNGRRLVIQSPAMSRYLVQVAGHHSKGVAVVWMLRPLGEILRSAERIGWDDAEERAKYEGLYSPSLPLPLVKYIYWTNKQKRLIKFPYEIRYYDLADHELWIPAAERRDFSKRQWRHDEKAAT